MTCIVVFLALLIERFFDWSHLRNWQWFTDYQQFINQRITHLNGWALLALTLLPIVLLVIILQAVMENLLFGFAGLFYSLMILLYALGPKNLWTEPFFANNPLALAEPHQTTPDISDASYNKSLHWYLLNHIFIATNVRFFAVIFWFIVLGPAGAMLYRMVALLSTNSSLQAVNDEVLTDNAKRLQAILDWLPIRLITILFALGGHFVQVFEMWRKYAPVGIADNSAMLTECGIAALGFRDQDKLPEDGTVEKSAENLIDRIFILIMALTIMGLFLW